MAGTPTNLTYSTETTLTITLASLTSSATAGRESFQVNNTSNNYLDAMVYLEIPTLATTTSANDKAIYVYAYGGVSGDDFTDTATGSDAAITLKTPTNLKLIQVISTPDTSTTYKAMIGSVANSFGGNLPPNWGIVVQNFSALTFNATENNFTKYYVGVRNTIG